MKQKTTILLTAYCIILTIAVAVLYVQTYTTQPKMAYVDSVKLLNNYKGMQLAKDQYQSTVQEWYARLDTLEGEFENALKKYEKEKATLSDKEAQMALELLQMKQKNALEYKKVADNKAREEDMRITGEVLAEVNNFIKEYADNHDYQIILAANESGNIAYAQENINLTDEILAALNEQYGTIE